MSGKARDVLQARDIRGGVHIYTRATSDTPIPRQLPGDVRGFIGRGRELAALEALAAEEPSAASLIVVVGTAGAGKTSLAVHFAHGVRGRFPDGQLFVNLRGYDAGPALGPASALERFLHALGTPPAAMPAELEERSELFRSLLAERRILVVLDNAATVGQVRPLLPGGPQCLVVVTSRSRLSGLSAREGARRVALGLFAEPEAVALIDTVTRGYRTGDDPVQVAQLARLCARLPLALRIAAERAAARPLMPLGELIEDLRGESSLWDALSDDDEQEADTVRAVFAWSYRALPPAAARAFRLLGINPGPDIGTMAAAALLEETSDRVRALLDALAGTHLIEQTAVRRYQLHDLLRAYAADQASLEESGETRCAALYRLASWYLLTAAAAVRATYPRLADPPAFAAAPSVQAVRFDDASDALEWFHTERANLLAVCRAAFAAGFDEIAAKLPDTLFLLYEATSSVDDLRETAQIGLQAARRRGDRAAQARGQRVLGFAHKIAGDLAQAAGCQRTSLALFEQIGSPAEAMLTANALGLVELDRRELPDAARLFEKTCELATDIGTNLWRAIAIDNLAAVHKEAGRYGPALELATQALESYRDAQADPQVSIASLLHLSRIHRETGDLSQAEVHMEEAARVLADVKFVSAECNLLLERAALHFALRRDDEAMETYWQALQMQRPLGDRTREAAVYTGLGRILVRLGRCQEALDFHEQAVSIRSKHPDAYLLAEALSYLAEALASLGHAPRASSVRREAVALLEAFDDPRATMLRESLEPD